MISNYIKNIKKLRHVINTNIYTKRRLKKQLRLLKHNDYKLDYYNKKILVTIYETNHYQHNHILGLAKVLQLRGAVVKVLVCNQHLNACEIRSVLNEEDSDPCFFCRYNLENIVSKFNFELIDPVSILSKEELKNINELENHSQLLENGISLDQCIEDSVVRYFYGRMTN